jgi:hypothetical protein
VLVAGGSNGFSALSSAEVFDPATGQFSSAGVGALGTARSDAVAAPLPDGRVLVASGYNASYLSSAEAFGTEQEPVSAGLDFGSQTVAQPSALKPLVITNMGTHALQVSGSALAGANPADYAIIDDACQGEVIAFEQSCSIQIRFTPGAEGPRPASLQLSDNASTSPHSFSLTGTGIAASSGPQPPEGTAGQGPAGSGDRRSAALKKCKKKSKSKRRKCRKRAQRLLLQG